MNICMRRLAMAATPIVLVMGGAVPAAAAVATATEVTVVAERSCVDDYSTGESEGYRAGLSAATKGQKSDADGANPCLTSNPHKNQQYNRGFTAGYAQGYAAAQTASAPGDEGDQGWWDDWDNGWWDDESHIG